MDDFPLWYKQTFACTARNTFILPLPHPYFLFPNLLQWFLSSLEEI